MIRCQECIFFFYQTCTCRRFPLKQLCSRSARQNREQSAFFFFLSMTDKNPFEGEPGVTCPLTMWYLPFQAAKHDLSYLCRRATREPVPLNAGRKTLVVNKPVSHYAGTWEIIAQQLQSAAFHLVVVLRKRGGGWGGKSNKRLCNQAGYFYFTFIGSALSLSLWPSRKKKSLSFQEQK